MAAGDLAALRVELDALKALVDVRFNAHEREHALMRDTAISSKENLEQRLHTLNEARAQIERAESKLLSKEEWQSGHKALWSKLGDLENWSERRFTENSTRVDERFTAFGTQVSADEKAIESRFRGIERLIYIATGAVAVIAFLLRWLKVS
jgi:hypothetical protein